MRLILCLSILSATILWQAVDFLSSNAMDQCLTAHQYNVCFQELNR